MNFTRPGYTLRSSSHTTSGYREQHFQRRSHSAPLAGTQIQNYRGCISRPQTRSILPVYPTIVTYIPPVLTQSPLVLPMCNTPSAALTSLPYPIAYSPEHIPRVLTVPHLFPSPPPSPQIPISFPFPSPSPQISISFPLPPPSPQIPISFPFSPPQLEVSPTPLPHSPSCSQNTPDMALRNLCDQDRYRLMVTLPVGYREDGTYGVLPGLPDNEEYTVGLYYADMH